MRTNQNFIGFSSHDLLLLADKYNTENKELEFQQVASELTNMEHSLFIDEMDDPLSRLFAIKSLLAEDDFWLINKGFKGLFEDTDQYHAIEKRYNFA